MTVSDPAGTAAGGGTVTVRREAVAESGPFTNFVTIPLRPEKFDEFLGVMRENVVGTRAEPGALTFDVYRLKSGGPDLFLIESFKNKSEFEIHKAAEHVPPVMTRVNTDLRAPLNMINIVKLSADAEPVELTSPSTTCNVITSLRLRPEARDRFVQKLLDTVAFARNAPGNISFDVWQHIDDPKAILIVERWENVEVYDSHLRQDYNAPLAAIVEASLATPLVDGPDGRRLLRDVSVE